MATIAALASAACGRVGFGAGDDTATDATVMGDANRCPTCDQGLVAYWPFDETSGAVATDVVGGHDAALKGVGISWGTGVRGGAVELDAGYGEVAWDMPAAVSGGFSVAMWIEQTPQSRAFDRYFSLFFWDGNNHGALLMDNFSGDGLRCAANLGGSFDFLENDAVYPASGWRHVACVYDGTSWKSYANGVLINSSMTSGVLTTTEMLPVGIGASIGATDYQNEVTAAIDDVRIYNRGLTTAELGALATL